MVVSILLLLFPSPLGSLSQDMEITANELKNVLNRVITKRESGYMNLSLSQCRAHINTSHQRRAVDSHIYITS